MVSCDAQTHEHIQYDVVAQRRFRRRMEQHFAGEPLIVDIRAEN